MEKNNIIAYCEANRDLEIIDLFKYLYQSCFGCEHLVSDPVSALDRIRREMNEADQDDLPKIEFLDGDFCRVHLKAINDNFSVETLCDLFVRSAEKQTEGLKRLEEKLVAIRNYADKGFIPFKTDELSAAVEEWRKAGFPAMHHSEKFRNAHHPVYRVIKKEFLNSFFALC